MILVAKSNPGSSIYHAGHHFHWKVEGDVVSCRIPEDVKTEPGTVISATEAANVLVKRFPASYSLSEAKVSAPEVKSTDSVKESSPETLSLAQIVDLLVVAIKTRADFDFVASALREKLPLFFEQAGEVMAKGNDEPKPDVAMPHPYPKKYRDVAKALLLPSVKDGKYMGPLVAANTALKDAKMPEASSLEQLNSLFA